jgi:hypothetical protein
MFAIYALFLYGCGLASLGVIALKAVPKLELTATNLLLFILGRSVGMVVFRQYFPLRCSSSIGFLGRSWRGPTW